MIKTNERTSSRARSRKHTRTHTYVNSSVLTTAKWRKGKLLSQNLTAVYKHSYFHHTESPLFETDTNS